MQTRDQEYALDAYKNVSSVKEGHKKEIGRKYGVMCHKLPILIHTAGLAQALAFVEARKAGKEAIYKTFLDNLGHTVGEDGLAAKARAAELNDYMRLTNHVMEALVWYKRFAQSILGVDASDRDDEEVVE